MDEEQISRMVEQSVEMTLSRNQALISQALFQGIDWEGDWQSALQQGMWNTMQMSARLAIQMTLTMLAEYGGLEFLPQEQPPRLEVLPGGKQAEKPGAGHPET